MERLLLHSCCYVLVSAAVVCIVLSTASVIRVIIIVYDNSYNFCLRKALAGDSNVI